MPDLMKHGMPSWVELITDDPDAARKFYGDLFGWEYGEMPTPDGPYGIAMVDGDRVSGIMGKPRENQDMPNCWGQYFTVDDCDAAAEKAVAGGATIIYPPTDIPTVGRFAVIQDPQGAVFSIMGYALD